MIIMMMTMMTIMPACRYSSTKLVLETLAPSIRDGTLLVLDELLQCTLCCHVTYCRTMSCSAVQGNVRQCNAMQCHTIQCNAM